MRLIKNSLMRFCLFLLKCTCINKYIKALIISFIKSDLFAIQGKNTDTISDFLVDYKTV